MYLSLFLTFLSAWLAIRGYRKSSLSYDGAITAFFVGAIHGFAGIPFFLILAVFFFSSSYLTKIKSDLKRQLEEDFKEGGKRDSIQVLFNSLPAVFICSVVVYLGDHFQWTVSFDTDPLSASLIFAFLGHYACCNGDTWSSELGILSQGDPWLITTGKRVPKGTNGGVSIIGLVASIAAGFAIGASLSLSFLIVTSHCALRDLLRVVFLGTISGLFGSLLDSFIGATAQYSGYNDKIKKVVSSPGPNTKHITGVNVFSNNTVNLISSIGCTIITPIASYLLMKIV